MDDCRNSALFNDQRRGDRKTGDSVSKLGIESIIKHAFEEWFLK